MIVLEGFKVEVTERESSVFNLKGLLVFPLVIIGAPFLLFGFLFFSAIDKIVGLFGKSQEDDWLSFTEKWNGNLFEFSEAFLPEDYAFNDSQNATWFSIGETLEFPMLNDFLFIDFDFKEQRAFLLGVKKLDKNLTLVALTEGGAQFKQLEAGEWAFNHDDHHDNEYCELCHLNKKEKTIYTLIPQLAK